MFRPKQIYELGQFSSLHRLQPNKNTFDTDLNTAVAALTPRQTFIYIAEYR